MAIQYHINFNENDAVTVSDYSTQGIAHTSINKVTIAAGDILLKGNFNGTDSEIVYPDVLDFGGTDNVSVFCKIKVTTGVAHVIMEKAGQWELSINASNKIVFYAVTGASSPVVSTTSIGSETWTTIGAVYTGTNVLIYLDGVLDKTSGLTGNMSVSTANVTVGSDSVGGSTFLTGDIETLSVYSQALVLAKVKALHDRPTGILTTFPDSTVFSLGDLLELTAKSSVAGSQCVITGDNGSNQHYLLPVGNDIPQEGDIAKHVGAIFTTTRQCVMKTDLTSSEPAMKVYTGVSTFTLPTPTVKIDCNGITNTSGLIGGYKAITATYTVLATDSFLDITSGTFTATLPTAVGIAGQEYTFKNSGTGVATIDGDGSETIDGDLTVVLAVQYGSITIKSDGANWLLI